MRVLPSPPSPPPFSCNRWGQARKASEYSGLGKLFRSRDAVPRGHFMDMRCAYAQPGLAKLERLTEILDDAAADGGKTIVFIFFRSVLDAVMAQAAPTLVLESDGAAGAATGHA